MDLITPNRHKPTAGSFPTAPRKVRHWIAGLYPVTSANSTRELLRGLKHSNRLDGAIKSRVEILEQFHPVVREVIDHAVGHYTGQNLPLSSPERNSFDTVTSLLMEMAFGYKIIVTESISNAAASHEKYRNQALRQAMQTLDELALRYLQVHRNIPVSLWQDFNALYRLAEGWKIHKGPELPKLHVASRVESLQQLFIRTHLLAVSGTFSLRRGQVFQLHNFLIRHVDKVRMFDPADNNIAGEHLFAVDLFSPAAACNYLFLNSADTSSLRVLRLDDFLATAREELDNTPNSVSALYEADVLTRESIALLIRNFSTRKRSLPRQYYHRHIEVIRGLKEIYATFQYTQSASVEPAEDAQLQLADNADTRDKQKNSGNDYITHPGYAASAGSNQAWEDVANRRMPTREPAKTAKGKTDPEAARHWVMLNRSQNGLGLMWDHGSRPQVSVGEIMACQTSLQGDTPEWIIGQVCWLRLSDHNQLYLGLENLAREIRPVLLERTKGSHNSVTTQTECLLTHVPGQQGEDSLITPAYMFHTGEVVHIRGDQEVQRFRLTSRTHSTGSFALFSIEPFGSSRTADALSEMDAIAFGLLDQDRKLKSE